MKQWGCFRFGKDTEKINFRLEAPEWVTLDKDNTLVPGNQEKKVTLKANVPCGKKGKYKVKVFASIDGKESIADEKTFSIEVQTQAQCAGEAPTTNKTLYAIIAVVVILLLVVAVFIYRKHTAVKITPLPIVQKSKKIVEKKFTEEEFEEVAGVGKQLGKWVVYIVVLLALLVGLTALGFYFKQFVEFFKIYWPYFLAGIVVLIMILGLLMNKKIKWRSVEQVVTKKEAQVAKKLLTKPKKQKEREGMGKGMKIFWSIVIIVIVLALVGYVAYYYKLLPYVVEFLKLYYVYVIAGVVALIVLIVVWKQFFEDK